MRRVIDKAFHPCALGLATALAMLAPSGAIAAPLSSHSSCPLPPSPILNLDLTRPYSDAIGSEADAALLAKHADETAPLKAWLTAVTKAADAADGKCTANLLGTWAGAGALLGDMRSKQAEYERKWTVAGAALAYLKVRAAVSPTERRGIEAWLAKLADAAYRFAAEPGHKRNNHWYWTGLGLGAVSLATGDEARWYLAHAIYSDALADIGSDGTLKMELARGKRALHYHGFALMPLVTLAELAAARGEDWYGEDGGRLHRLVAATLAGQRDPSRFAELAGVAQEASPSLDTGWLYLYARRFPERATGPLPLAKRSHRWLGGDVAKLVK